MLYNILYDFFRFVRKPDDHQTEDKFAKRFLTTSILLLFHLTTLYIFVVPLLSIFDRLIDGQAVEDRYFSLTTALVFFVLIIPFFEELIFRYNLRYQGFKVLIISNAKWVKLFPYLIYSSSITFALLHLGYYSEITTLILGFAPLLVFPQLLGGLICSYLRVRFSFFWAILFHWLWNLSVIVLIPCILQLFTEPHFESTERFSLSIEYKIFLNEPKHILEFESEQGNIKYVDARYSKLSEILDTLEIERKNLKEDGLVNLHFVSPQGVSKKEFLKLLNDL